MGGEEGPLESVTFDQLLDAIDNEIRSMGKD